MNREDILRMAREASYPSFEFTSPSTLERFAALVAAAEREAIWNLLFEYAGRDD